MSELRVDLSSRKGRLMVDEHVVVKGSIQRARRRGVRYQGTINKRHQVSGSQRLRISQASSICAQLANIEQGARLFPGQANDFELKTNKIVSMRANIIQAASRATRCEVIAFDLP
ncbi:MAG TPA: hypothetical protein VEA80_17685 [Vitreimonas sp.]|nr:hypothetical protein [Vitreimonas sp.]